MPDILDDRSEHCVPFIVDRLRLHLRHYERQGTVAPPFFLGMNGVQGAGKTTLVSTLLKTLSSPPHSLSIVVLSIDDLYLPHEQQRALANSHPEISLIQHRGVPSTHDVRIGKELFEAFLRRESDIKIPSYDKSQFSGAGDRKPEKDWETVNRKGGRSVEVVLFEGWCVGFRALRDEEVVKKWKESKEHAEKKDGSYSGQLGKLSLEEASFVNSRLQEYDVLTDHFGAFIHIDAEDTLYVYDWREEQEAAMRATKGMGMSKENVVNFVNGYYPCYELYTDQLRRGIFSSEKGKQLRLVVGKDRKVKSVQVV